MEKEGLEERTEEERWKEGGGRREEEIERLRED